jgi:rhamnogalacturonan endolyase
MKGFFLAVASAFIYFSGVWSLPAERASGPFLNQIDNETWIIGNEVWNMTQQQTFGVKLMYRGKDCVGEAVGHYVSYSMQPCPIRNGKAANTKQMALSPT